MKYQHEKVRSKEKIYIGDKEEISTTDISCRYDFSR